MSDHLNKEIVFLMLQYCDEKNYKNAFHWLATNSGFYFDMKYFENAVTNGEWDEVEKYLSAFTKFDDNPHSLSIFFEIRKQRYLEALDKPDYGKAAEILRNDLTVLFTSHDSVLDEMTLLLRLPNLRNHSKLVNYGDTKTARSSLLGKLRKFIEKNPLFKDKLQFPRLENSRLPTLINQSLNWQHYLCENPKSDIDIKTLFVDHLCEQTYGTQARSGVSTHLASHAPDTASLGKWRTPRGPRGFSAPNNAAMGYYTADYEPVPKRARTLGLLDKTDPAPASTTLVMKCPINIFPVTSPGQTHPQFSLSSYDLPNTVIGILNHFSAVKSMDFHPVQQTLLLVGTNIGDIEVSEVGRMYNLVHRTFQVRDLAACSTTLQAAIVKKPSVSVNRVMWSPDGTLCGVAYSLHIVHIYSYHAIDILRDHLEIDAHVGNVSDLAFSHLDEQLCIITCGEDKAIRVWNTATGSKQYTFEGHAAPVYSLCPHQKHNVQYIISNSVDGKMKAWLYHANGPQIEFDAPGQSCARMAYSDDGTRLFSCGTNKDGESHIVEWDESEGVTKRSYVGLGKRAMGVVHFDTTKNRFLAAGDEFLIKFWDTEDVNLLTTTDASGGLPASPCIRFSKEGVLLAVSTTENSVKILGNAKGYQLALAACNQTSGPCLVVAGNIAKSPVIGVYGNSSLGAATNIAPVYSRSVDPSRVVAENVRTVYNALDPSRPVAKNVSKLPIIRPPSLSAVMNTAVLATDAPVAAIVPPTGDSCTSPVVNHRMTGDIEKARVLKPEEISNQSQLRCLRLPDTLLTAQITRLIYTYSGGAILALTSNGVHKLWKWHKNELNLDGKATVNVLPESWQPPSGRLITNDISETKPKDAAPCLALTNNDIYVISGSGGKISVFTLETNKIMQTWVPKPHASTSLALHPLDNNIIALGMEDSSIQIYNPVINVVKRKLEGHQDRVTGLAFSIVLKALVSSGADGQICVWSTDGWNKQASTFVHISSGQAPNQRGQHRVQFHQDQTHLLVFHENLISIYEAPELKCITQWYPGKSYGPITDARYSCNSRSVYAAFESGIIVVFTAALTIKCQINPEAYLTASPSLQLNSSRVYPLVIAAHPNDPNQFALGLSDGGVQVLEPPESDGRWGVITIPSP
ncbi:hypothetical protein AgCh_011138 [Apium graveolens]